MSASDIARRAAVAHIAVRRAVGRAGAVGLALLALAGTLGVTGEHMRDEARALGERAAAESAPGAGTAPAASSVDPAALRDGFPPLVQLHEDLRVVFRLAAEQKIALPRGEYATSARRDAGLTAYDIVLPVRGSYPAIRRLVASVLNNLPHAGLTELRLERGQGTAAAIDARLRFTLHYRGN